VIAHRFALEVPADVPEALALAARHGDAARPLAGGTVLLPELGRGAARPACIIALDRCGLDTVTRSDAMLVLGACTTYRQLALAPEPGLLGSFARGVTGGAQVRNRATIGGSAAWANPSSDAPGVLTALEAVMVLRSTEGERRLPCERFFVDAFRTALLPGELLVAVEVPVRAGVRHGYRKLKFGESSWPIVTASAVVRRDGSARIALGGASAVPLAVEVERADEVADAVRAALVEPWSDVLAGGEYRRRVAPVIARRALEAAA
jgi:aerobic carbon-monoxide dehydrogenase medium subunit